MDNLRSLEGVGQLLSQKLNQHSKVSSKPAHKRCTSVPINPNINTTPNIIISTYFPPNLAATLANSVNRTFDEQMPATEPALIKSSSDFARKATNKKQKPSPPNTTTPRTHTAVHFTQEVNYVASPKTSMSPAMSPSLSAFKDSYNSQRGSLHHQCSNGYSQAFPSSPSGRMGSFAFGANSLHLNLGDINLFGDEDELSTLNSNRGSAFPLTLNDGNSNNNNPNSNSMPPILSPMDMEYHNSPKNGNAVPALPRQYSYSNKELFTLFSDNEMVSSPDDDLVANNTALNSSVPKDCIPVLSEMKSNGFSAYNNNDIDMNLNFEDFMEYQSEQKRDTFNNIGNGASGIVRKAFHFRSCKMVAIKQCRSKQKHEINAFQREAKLYSLFSDNRNIANILGFGKDNDNNGNFSMAMEYMDLGSVDSLKINEIKDSNINKEWIVGHIIFNALKGLNALHERLYVHNDIKPANVLCNRYGEIQLSDFGTVLQLKTKKHFLSKNNGTQRYQSPEKMVKQPIRYNTKSDVWSIGVSTFELLFGDSYNESDDLAFITNTPNMRDTKKYGIISKECADFIQKCLTVSYKNRPSTAELLTHAWFNEKQQFIGMDLNESIWPWYRPMPGKAEECMVQNAIDNYDNLKSGHGRRRSKGINKGKNKENNLNNALYNQDLLFMISAFVIYYSAQSFDTQNENENGQNRGLHRRKSEFKSGKGYSDDERITNMAKYACCSKELVMSKIKVTVDYIKSQISQL